jgi:hypothetical protein
MTDLIWLHPDCLAADNPAYLNSPGAPALFVFDEDEIEAEGWSLKRIAFLYETLLELPCEIARGQVVEELLARQPGRIVTVDSVNPRFRAYVQQLRKQAPVEVLPAAPFVDYPGHLDLKRFSRYWKRVEPLIFGK